MFSGAEPATPLEHRAKRRERGKTRQRASVRIDSKFKWHAGSEVKKGGLKTDFTVQLPQKPLRRTPDIRRDFSGIKMRIMWWISPHISNFHIIKTIFIQNKIKNSGNLHNFDNLKIQTWVRWSCKKKTWRQNHELLSLSRLYERPFVSLVSRL